MFRRNETTQKDNHLQRESLATASPWRFIKCHLVLSQIQLQWHHGLVCKTADTGLCFWGCSSGFVPRPGLARPHGTGCRCRECSCTSGAAALGGKMMLWVRSPSALSVSPKRRDLFVCLF